MPFEAERLASFLAPAAAPGTAAAAASAEPPMSSERREPCRSPIEFSFDIFTSAFQETYVVDKQRWCVLSVRARALDELRRAGSGSGGDRSDRPPRTQEGHLVEHLFLELLQVEVDDRRDVEGDELRHHQTADDGETQGTARRSVRTVAQRDGQRADDRCHRGHD